MKKRLKKPNAVIGVILICFIVLSISGCDKPPNRRSYVAGINKEFQIALNDNGSVRVQGLSKNEYDFSNWNNIRSVSVGLLNAAGIRRNGTVIVMGNNEFGACEVDNWRNISMVECSIFITWGLKGNGTVVHTGHNYEDEILEGKIMDEVDTWKDIVYIDTSQFSIVGIKANGEVVAATAWSPELEEQVKEWENVKTVSVSCDTIVGITYDGEVLVALDNIDQFMVTDEHLKRYQDMKGAVEICSGQSYVAGLMPDGTLKVRMIYGGEDWEEDVKALDGETNVVDINSFEDYLTVLKEDGTIIAAGYVE